MGTANLSARSIRGPHQVMVKGREDPLRIGLPGRVHLQLSSPTNNSRLRQDRPYLGVVQRHVVSRPLAFDRGPPHPHAVPRFFLMGHIFDPQGQNRTDSHTGPQAGDKNRPFPGSGRTVEDGERAIDFVWG